MFSVAANVRPTTNQAPAKTASQPPNMALARFPAASSSRPPTAAATPGSTSSHPLAVVHVHAGSTVYAQLKMGPMNGINAPQAPNRIRISPVTAPRVRGMYSARGRS